MTWSFSAKGTGIHSQDAIESAETKGADLADAHVIRAAKNAARHLTESIADPTSAVAVSVTGGSDPATKTRGERRFVSISFSTTKEA